MFQIATGLTLAEKAWVGKNLILPLWGNNSTAGEWNAEALGHPEGRVPCEFLKLNNNSKFSIINPKTIDMLKDNIMKKHMGG